MDLILTWAGFRYLLPHMFPREMEFFLAKMEMWGKVQETLLVNRLQSDFAQTLHAPLCKIRTLAPFSFEDFEQLYIRYQIIIRYLQ